MGGVAKTWWVAVACRCGGCAGASALPVVLPFGFLARACVLSKRCLLDFAFISANSCSIGTECKSACLAILRKCPNKQQQPNQEGTTS
eukprot:4625549-Amphidinium_carterae.1